MAATLAGACLIMNTFTHENAILARLRHADAALRRLAVLDLAESNAFVRAAVLRALKPLRSVSALSAACKSLSDAETEVRRAAVGVLGHLTEYEAILALHNAIGDASPDVRRAAVAALAAKGIAASEALQDTDWQVRQAAAEAVGKAKATQAFDALLTALNDEYWQVRQKAAWSLGQLNLPQAVIGLGQAIVGTSSKQCAQGSGGGLGGNWHSRSTGMVAPGLGRPRCRCAQTGEPG